MLQKMWAGQSHLLGGSGWEIELSTSAEGVQGAELVDWIRRNEKGSPCRYDHLCYVRDLGDMCIFFFSIISAGKEESRTVRQRHVRRSD